MLTKTLSHVLKVAGLTLGITYYKVVGNSLKVYLQRMKMLYNIRDAAVGSGMESAPYAEYMSPPFQLQLACSCTQSVQYTEAHRLPVCSPNILGFCAPEDNCLAGVS